MSTGEVSGDEAAWRDLVERYGMDPDVADGAPPWPEREDLRNPPADHPHADHPHAEGGTGIDRTRVIRPAAPAPAQAPATEAGTAPNSPDPPPAASAPAAPPAPRIGKGTASSRASETDAGLADEDDHYVPPLPPPLPRLDSMAKGAWTALVAGPGYLIVATALGWTIPGWAALLAVAAFVGGFAVVVLRLGDDPSRGDGPGGGAVV